MTSRIGAIVVPVLAIPLLGIIGLVALSAGGSFNASADVGLQAGSICATTGPIAGLSQDAAQNARVVAAVASARAGDQAALIVEMTGLAESGLRVLGNPTQLSGSLPTQGVGFDHDSLGIFQQRPSWGSAQQRLDPIESTNLLLDRLLAEPGWQSLQPWVAAQRIQDSAYDGSPRPDNHFSSEYGGNYHAQLERASQILVQVESDSTRTGCDGSGGSPTGTEPAGPPGRHGLPIDYAVPQTSAQGTEAVLAALAELGRPYVFGAAGPSTFDCSGLMQWAWARAGVELPHYTGDQWHAGTGTSASALLPGDLVLVPGSDGTVADPQHVGMYIGRGLVVEAPETGDVVKVVTYASFISDGLSGLRHIA